MDEECRIHRTLWQAAQVNKSEEGIHNIIISIGLIEKGMSSLFLFLNRNSRVGFLPFQMGSLDSEEFG